jgi:hypothetical protein
MNILCIFAIYTGFSTLSLFFKFIQTQISGVNSNFIQTFINFATSYTLFFIIPIIVSIAKLYKLFISLFSNISFNLDFKYKLIFLTIVLFSFYHTIQTDLDTTLKFPFSMIYAIVSIFSIMYLYYKRPVQGQTIIPASTNAK